MINPKLIGDTFDYSIFNSNAQGQILTTLSSVTNSPFNEDYISYNKSMQGGNYYVIRIGYKDHCGYVKNVDALIKVVSLPSAIADFVLIQPIGSGITPILPTTTSYPLLGSVTCGIVNLTQATANYQLRVSIFDAGLIMGSVVYNSPGPNFLVYFNTIKLKGQFDYFKDNWATIKDKGAFSVLVTVTDDCGKEYNVKSNFRITGACQTCKVAQEKGLTEAIEQELQKDESLLVESQEIFFPNPVSDVAYISLGANEGGVVDVYSTIGQLVLSKKENNTSSIELNVSNLPSGMYIYHLKTANSLQKGKFNKI